jgi:hypothetical protein
MIVSCCCCKSVHAEAALAVLVGFFFSPLSHGLTYYLLTVFTIELIAALVSNNWTLAGKIYVIILGLIGWIIGRLFFGLDLF